MISFRDLQSDDLALLYKWLMTPHVRKWWDSDVNWDLEKVGEKYGERINNAAIKAYIVIFDNKEIGYMQIYDAYKFPRSKPLLDLPKSLAGFDIFIGEEDFLNKGLGAEILKDFIEKHCDYDYIFVDPDCNNDAAINAYKKAGFQELETQQDVNELWMMRKK